MYLSWVEISRSAILHNLRLFKRLVGNNVEVMPIIKSNAYGHGSAEVATIISNEVNWLGVVDLSEALFLRRMKIKNNILALSYVENDLLKQGIKAKIDLPIYDFETAQQINRLAGKLKQLAKVHIKIDTGAARIGILPKETVSFVRKVSGLSNLKIRGIYSHFSAAEENEKYTKFQVNIFRSILVELKKNKINIPLKHFACSAATLVRPESHFNLVRLGLVLYGLWPSDQIRKKIMRKHPNFKLQPALEWKTKIIQVKEIPVGSKIGYGCTYTAGKKMKLAIIGVGYWEGYDRKLSNQGVVIIKNIKCPIVGRICMNLSMADVTKVKNVKPGDEVILLGGGESADQMAKKNGTINYEVVTRINPILTRIIK
ncbi:MAG: alanine racemase [Patescibacteria group bacterium]|nr:alanine racemase [Patescibacteria group bacterium]